MKYKCPCCGYYTYDHEPDGSYDICPVCFWEDDPIQSADPTYTGGANHVSLQQGRLNFQAFGSCEKEMLPHVRKPAMDELAPARIYQTNLGDIHYWVSRAGADRPWLALLPGLAADHRLFDRQTEGLGGDFNLLTWDAPAHGASRPFRLAFTLEDMARYLRGILEAENITKPILVGQSLGGYIAQVYMALYPDTVAGFVSIDSCSMKRKYYTGAELFLLKHTEGMYRAFPWRWLLQLGGSGNAETEYGRNLAVEMFSAYEKGEFCALAGHGFRILAQSIEKGGDYDITCPVLLLCGEKDGAGSGKRYNRAWAKQDGHRLVWIPGAGHCSNADAPEMVNGLLRDFALNLPRMRKEEQT